jgi:hypothetical protein
MGVTLDELLGEAKATPSDEGRVRELSAAIRRFDLPGESEPAEDVARRLADVVERRGRADLSGVLARLPSLVSAAQSRAHATGDPEDWAAVSSTYSAVYWLAARHRWMHLADLAVMRQRTAAELSSPLTLAVAARDEAGTFLNGGDFDGGMMVVDRAIVSAESISDPYQRAVSLNLLHLRALTLAGRARDKGAVAQHRTAAMQTAEEFSEDVDVDGITVGPGNTLTHVIATSVDMDSYRAALDATEHALRIVNELPPTRVAPLHMNIARARLALKDRDGALSDLLNAWEVAPQMARVHPTSQELLRVLVSLHQRSNPTLTKLAKRAGVAL